MPKVFGRFTLKYKVLYYLCFSTVIQQQKTSAMTTQNKRLTAIVLSVFFLLSLPLIAMQFTSEVNWSPFDFAVAGVLLLGTGLLCELVIRSVKKISIRTILLAGLLLGLVLIWLELAVGIFGTPLAGS